MTVKYNKLKSQWDIWSKRLVCGALCVCLTLGNAVAPAAVHASALADLPAPGSLVLTSEVFQPPVLAGLSIDPGNPLMFEFLIDVGDSRPAPEELSREATDLIKYFLTAVTVPEDHLWVNLSPRDQDRIVAAGLSETLMGRDLLSQDYLLKQLAASLLSPEEKTGKEFWRRLLSQASLEQQIPLETLNRIWIVPQRAEIYVQDNKIFLTDARLKVMLEQDYLALPNREAGPAKNDPLPDATAELIREIVLPVVEEEINSGETFAKLRQIYTAMVLATWFKRNLRTNILNNVYADRSKTEGIAQPDRATNQRIYEQYLKALKKGVYNQVREEFDPLTRETVPRKYFSGGVDARNIEQVLSVRQSNGRGGDQALLSRLADREEFLYVIQAGLQDTRGQLSYQQTKVKPRLPERQAADAAILAVLDDVIRHEEVAMASMKCPRPNSDRYGCRIKHV